MVYVVSGFPLYTVWFMLSCPKHSLTLITNWPGALLSCQVIAPAVQQIILTVNHHQRRDFDHMQTCKPPNNPEKSVILNILVLEFHNYLKNYCPQEGSVITFILIYSQYLRRPDPASGERLRWLKGEREGRKHNGGRIQLVIPRELQLPHEVK